MCKSRDIRRATHREIFDCTLPLISEIVSYFLTLSFFYVELLLVSFGAAFHPHTDGVYFVETTCQSQVKQLKWLLYSPFLAGERTGEPNIHTFKVRCNTKFKWTTRRWTGEQVEVRDTERGRERELTHTLAGTL